MANCLKCAHAKAIARLRKKCLACSIGQPSCGLSHGGRSFVSMDSVDNPALVLAKGGVAADFVLPGEVLADKEDPLPEPVNTDLGADERENLLRVLSKFASLKWDDAGLVCRMLAGKTHEEIARERKVAPQNIHSRWKRVIKKDPVWEALANGMIGSGRGRKPTPRRVTQLLLGL